MRRGPVVGDDVPRHARLLVGDDVPRHARLLVGDNVPRRAGLLVGDNVPRHARLLVANVEPLREPTRAALALRASLGARGESSAWRQSRCAPAALRGTMSSAGRHCGFVEAG